MPSTARPPWLAYACLTFSMAIVGCYLGLSKLLVLVFPVFLLAGLRFGIAAVLMAHWLRRSPEEAPLDPRSKWLLFLESFLGNFLFSIFLLFGMKSSSAVVAGVIMAGMPAAVALLSWLTLGERIAPRVMAGITLGVGGIALVAFSKHESGPGTSPLGALLLLGAMFCEASYVVIGKKLTAHLSPKRISALINLWGLVLVAPLALWQGLTFDFSAPTLPIWGLLLFYAGAASMLTVWLWMTGLKRVPAARAGVFMVFLPIATGGVGLALGEPLGWPQALAYGLALAGVVLATTSKA